MAVVTPSTPNEVIEQGQQDAKNELPSTNPWLESGMLRAMVVSNARRVYDAFKGIDRAVEQSFPFKAVGKFLQFWATLKNMLPLTAEKTTGPITFTGIAGNTVPADSIWKVGTTEYTVDDPLVIALNLIEVASLYASGTTGICNTLVDHQLRNGMTVTFSGVNQTEWNAAWENIIVTGDRQIQFTVPDTIESPATGTIEMSYTSASGNVTSVEAGDYNNLANGVVLEAAVSHSGIDDAAGTQYQGLSGGRDDETRDEYSERIIYRWQNPETPFNPAKIIALVKGLDGGRNTRAWVRRVTPEVGALSVFFVRDGDESIIPGATVVAEVKAEIVAISSPQTEIADIHVNDPLVGVPVDSVISNVLPSTTTMKDSVKARIKNYHRGGGLTGGLEEGENFILEQFRADLYQTVDYQTGEVIRGFTIAAPVADQQIDEGEIAVEGSTSVG